MENNQINSIKELKVTGKTLMKYLEEMKFEWGKQPLKPLDKSQIKSLYELLKVKEFVLLVFSASWCKDCKLHVPEVSTIQETLLNNFNYDFEVIVFSGLKFDSLNPENFWKVPPSPVEAVKFNIIALPTLILLEKESGKEVGRVTEHPQENRNILEELIFLLSR